jgi:hypothetical protein
MEIRRIALPVVVLALLALCAPPLAAQEEELTCDAARSAPLVPTDRALCERLWPIVKDPSALPLDEYETKLGDFLRNWCHRDAAAGWKPDKRVRDTGPYIATLDDGKWVGQYHGTHAPVVIWYSPEMLDWLHGNRPLDEASAPAEPVPIPPGAVMVKEMFEPPAADCAGVDVRRLLPPNGAAVMVRDPDASQDGWFWGWFGWSGWDPDWPAGRSARLPYMGFGQYCVNCHASAQDGLTFADLKNVEGEPGEPLVFLSQHFFDIEPVPSHHRLVALPTDDPSRLGQPHFGYSPAFVRSLPAGGLPRPSWDGVSKMPPQTYDNVWVEAGTPTAASEFVTSDQCLGCHDAGGTGLQYDMTVPNPANPELLLNLSPYGTWRTSPMGLGGRDPIFFAQLASEVDTFHPEENLPAVIQDTCLGCHGITGQRQFKIDHGPGAGGHAHDAAAAHADYGAGIGGEECPPFLRPMVDAIPWPDGNPGAAEAPYGALARDGISCTACHRMLVGVGDGPALDEPENRCMRQRQQFLNPTNQGFARTFTGSFLVGPPDELKGPFEDPKTKPMDHALGNLPTYDDSILAAEVCGSCHTVHLPVIAGADVIGHTYEQTTYPEWAFSAYRTGTTPQGTLPSGAGAKAQSCQGCHMRREDRSGKKFSSKIAGIQEYSNFPEAEHNLGPEDIDLAVREGFARHTLVGLNVFFLKMAQQFPDVLGIRTQDPMMVSTGVDPTLFTEQAMLEQATHDTAKVTVSDLGTAAGKLTAKVTVDSMTGHKLPSGVGFRRAFLEFRVLDAAGNVIWTSGGTDPAGVIVDQDGDPLPGELWWQDDCSGLRYDPPAELPHQPHYQKITRQDQAQIYQELVTAPGSGPNPRCGLDAPPEGPFTTSFLSICAHVKDNRILPDGFLPLKDRIAISKKLGAGEDMARDSGPKAVGDDPDYVTGGKDSLVYEVDLAGLGARPAAVKATLYYQATPPFYLQDRFCTSKSDDTQRLYFLAGHLNLQGTQAESWKFEVVGSGEVAVE